MAAGLKLLNALWFLNARGRIPARRTKHAPPATFRPAAFRPDTLRPAALQPVFRPLFA